MKKIVLVIGGTGMLGQPVSLCLKEAGFQSMLKDREQALTVIVVVPHWRRLGFARSLPHHETNTE